MENVGTVEELEKQVRRRLVDVTLTIDPPTSPTGSWWIDVQRYGRVASIEWRPEKGFGIAAPNGGYGEGVDFIVTDAAAAAEYVARVLQPYSSETDTAAALATHIDTYVSDLVHWTIERLLGKLRKQVGDKPVDLNTFEQELTQITEEILAERRTNASDASRVRN